MLSDADLIRAAQSGGGPKTPAKQQFVIRFGQRLRYLSAKACQLHGLHLSEIDDVVQIATAGIFDPGRARFDATRAKAGCESYLRGFVQNAARTHARDLRRGDEQRHNWTDPTNERLDLPVSLGAVRDSRDTSLIPETSELAAVVLELADPSERILVNRVFWKGESVAEIAVAIGVDRTTVTRRLNRFYQRVRVRPSLSCLVGR